MSEPASFSHSRHVELNASLSNSALLPTTERTWSWFDYLSFWMSDVHSVGTYVTLGNLFASDLPGMAVAIGLLVGILLVQILCNLVAVPSQQTGAPFPVICRASFGVKGALIPAFVRGVIAVCWYGIQTWLASNALVVLILKCAPALSSWADIGQHVRRQDLWDEIGELNNGGFLAHRNDEGVKYEPEILAGDDIGGTVDPRYPPGDASAVFGGREDPHCA
ncbi:permease for cytosine/purines, uracil, thiamine, allantoin [Acetobacter senegalensis]|uniref:Permease for cytosine/purines, uracil, thiamine, allantoin n=1 Tax=Acetobacter senegalensis TaxID=446692 RepID=A0A0U5F1R9_9PROT|nr:permease for cytosine/purines, uracil, thiamine, allantoin [Acetobacter senegalensis]